MVRDEKMRKSFELSSSISPTWRTIESWNFNNQQIWQWVLEWVVIVGDYLAIKVERVERVVKPLRDGIYWLSLGLPRNLPSYTPNRCLQVYPWLRSLLLNLPLHESSHVIYRWQVEAVGSLLKFFDSLLRPSTWRLLRSMSPGSVLLENPAIWV